jgi:peptide/nickel transport system permease protein
MMLSRLLQSDAFYSFSRQPLVIVSTLVATLFLTSALLAPWVAPHNPFDLSTVTLLDAKMPPAWLEGGSWTYPLGTDHQGRDILSAIIYGSRVSLAVALPATLAAMTIGVSLGLLAGYAGGRIDSMLMRLADIQLSFPAILVALLIDGTARVVAPKSLHDELAIWVMIAAITLATWVHFARPVRAQTLVEKRKDYVQAARLLQIPPTAIVLRHILLNVIEPVLVIATVGFGLAIITEATLSFLGVGMPASQPSLGTLVRTGNDFLFSGFWWMAIFPGVALLMLVMSVNLLGDWLRDVFNPRLG